MNDPIKRPAILAVSFLALALSLALGSCADDAVGIFYQVANEQDLAANMTKGLEEATPAFVARVGSTSYLGAGSLWKKSAGEGKWTELPKISGISPVKDGTASNILAVSGVSDGSSLYVLFYGPNDDASLGVWKTADGSDWTVVEGLPSDEAAERLLYANGQVFAVTRKAIGAETGYSIRYLSGGAFAATGIGANTDIGSPDSVAYAGTTYWFTAGGYLLAGDTMAGLAKVSGPVDWATPSTVEKPLAATYGGVCAVGSDVVVSGRSGRLYLSADGGATWKASAPQTNSASSAYSFSVPTYVGVGSKPLVAVGTDSVARASTDQPAANGYLEYAAADLAAEGAAPDAAHATLADSTNYNASLAGKIVTAMPLVDEGSGTFRLYALTQGAGLWSNAYSAGAWGKWVRE